MECTRDITSVLHGNIVNLQRMTSADIKPLYKIMQDPEIIKWWGQHDEQSIRDHLIDQDLVLVYTVRAGAAEDNGPIIGSIQAFEEPSPEFRHAGMDLFIDNSLRKQGYGTDTILTMVKHLFFDLGHHRIVVQPSADNVAAIAVWEKVGFKRAGYLRQYQRDQDGEWQDAVLLEAIIGDIAI